ncbi:UPF0058 family protein [Natronosalvus rutilus]|uniref:UPF0058 family protein n=1 Tax=Natronosalvus rutilus TaxID=2953753 RepID=A0A9E7N8Z2_9EURY|nr:UPF0058 family protein [Natronosalvus rutilus]UTF52583.1 UPF0058 family protein [Natronosalvus rutilus]
MRKQELIHLHALAVELRKDVTEHETVPPDAFEEYDRYGIAPTSIHYNKPRHKESLLLLLDGICRTVGRPPTQDLPDGMR